MGIYGAGKAFNLRYAHRQAIPQHRASKTPQQPIIMGHQHCTPSQTTVEINYGPKGFWGFMAGFASSGALGSMFNFIGGLFGRGNQNMGVSPYGQLNQAQGLQQTGQNPGGMDELSKLKQMFPKHTFIPEGNGQYRARDDAGTIYGPATYDQMYSLLQSQPSTPVSSTPGSSAPISSTPISSTPISSTPGSSTPKTTTTRTSTPKTTTPKNATPPVGNGQYSAQSVKKPGNDNETIDKTKPVRLNMTIARSQMSGAITVTVVTPDGKTYKESLGTNGDGGLAIVSKTMLKRLNEAGWTNVTLENKNFNWSSDGSKAEGKVDKPQTKEYNATEKAKPIKLTISFAVRSGGGIGNSGSATVTTPDGKLHQVTTSMHWTATNARKDLAEKMQAQLKAAGWTNATLENKNFNDWH